MNKGYFFGEKPRFLRCFIKRQEFVGMRIQLIIARKTTGNGSEKIWRGKGVVRCKMLVMSELGGFFAGSFTDTLYCF